MDFKSLFKAVQERNVTEVKRLIQLGGSVILPSANLSLFCVAAQNGHVDIIEAMSASKADVNIPNRNGLLLC